MRTLQAMGLCHSVTGLFWNASKLTLYSQHICLRNEVSDEILVELGESCPSSYQELSEILLLKLKRLLEI